jgi:regulator of cell morphogenesis and NO signaling
MPENATMPAASSFQADHDFANRTLADIATTLPGATALFRKAKLDFCCGGKVSLKEAATAKNRDLADLAAQLAALAVDAAPHDKPADTDALIALIETRYHATHRRELPELVRLARRVEAVHRDVASAPHGLAGLLERMAGELESHMQKEEQILFPLMRKGGHPMISQPIAMMLAEHDDHGEHLRALEKLTNDFTPPPEACTTWRALYAGSRKLADDLIEHIHTENNILFPRFTR